VNKKFASGGDLEVKRIFTRQRRRRIDFRRLEVDSSDCECHLMHNPSTFLSFLRLRAVKTSRHGQQQLQFTPE
jgi:hypothetical protein